VQVEPRDLVGRPRDYILTIWQSAAVWCDQRLEN